MVTEADITSIREQVLRIAQQISDGVDCILVARRKLRKVFAMIDNVEEDLKKLCDSVQTVKNPQ